ncbi:MAG: type II toxin-antitoxin system Phd/YefM family antitoxin [Kiritimatiellia bacterium]|jgi:prevent-host-death family protein
MKSTYSISEAQAKLPSILRDPRATFVPITRHSETVGYLLSKNRMDAIVETMELLADPQAMKAIDKARARKTRYTSLDRIRED